MTNFVEIETAPRSLRCEDCRTPIDLVRPGYRPSDLGYPKQRYRCEACEIGRASDAERETIVWLYRDGKALRDRARYEAHLNERLAATWEIHDLRVDADDQGFTHELRGVTIRTVFVWAAEFSPAIAPFVGSRKEITIAALLPVGDLIVIPDGSTALQSWDIGTAETSLRTIHAVNDASRQRLGQLANEYRTDGDFTRWALDRRGRTEGSGYDITADDIAKAIRTLDAQGKVTKQAVAQLLGPSEDTIDRLLKPDTFTALKRRILAEGNQR